MKHPIKLCIFLLTTAILTCASVVLLSPKTESSEQRYATISKEKLMPEKFSGEFVVGDGIVYATYAKDYVSGDQTKQVLSYDDTQAETQFGETLDGGKFGFSTYGDLCIRFLKEQPGGGGAIFKIG